jgi:hypothetical protein
MRKFHAVIRRHKKGFMWLVVSSCGRYLRGYCASAAIGQRRVEASIACFSECPCCAKS